MSKRRPCPICGRPEFCGLLEDDSRGGVIAVRCAEGRWLRPLPGFPAPGFVPSPKGVDAYGCLTFFVDDGTGGGGRGGGGGGGVKPLSAEERAAFAQRQAERDEETERYRRASIAAAKGIWRGAAGTPESPAIEGELPACADGRGVDHPRVRAYLAARGVLVERLPRGRVPGSIRYHGACPHEHEDDQGQRRKDRLPALVGCYTSAQRECVAVQRIYLDVLGAPRKAAGIEPVKQTRGSLSSGQAVRLTGANAGGDGTLIVAEGLETALGVLCGVTDIRKGEPVPRAAVWSVLSTSGLKNLPAMLRDTDIVPDAGGWIRRVVVAADLDREQAGKRPGTHAAQVFAQRMRELWPEVEVRVVAPGHAHAPGLIDEAGEIVGQAKSVDWLDVLVAAGPRGPSVIAEAMLPKGDAEVERLNFLPKQRTLRAQQMLAKLFAPEIDPAGGQGRAGMVFGLRRYAAKWWTYRAGARPRWVDETDDERLVARAGALYDEFYERLADGTVRPASLTGGAVEDVLRAAVNYTSVSGADQPAWLPPQFDRLGRADWSSTVVFADNTVDAPVRQDATPIKATDVVAFPNGLLDVGAWEQGVLSMLPTTPRFFSRSCLPFPLPVEVISKVNLQEADAGAEAWSALCPKWLNFLGETFEHDEESIRTLQRWFGYCLTSDIRYEKILWLQGPGGSGKGTITQMLERVVGEENVAQTDLDKLGQRFGLSSLVGRSLITMPELRVGFRTDTALGMSTLLSISAGDALSIEDKFSRAKPAVRITGKIMVTPNEEPNLRDSAAALIRRLIVIPTLRPALNPDSTLKARLAAEAPGVMVWALFGLLDLRRAGGFAQPRAGQEIMHEMRRTLSPAHAFVEDCCVAGKGNTVITSALYALYCQWQDRQGGKPSSVASFGTQLKAAVPGIDRVDVPGQRGVRMYIGVRPAIAGVDAEYAGHVWCEEGLDGRPLTRSDGAPDLRFAPVAPHAP